MQAECRQKDVKTIPRMEFFSSWEKTRRLYYQDSKKSLFRGMERVDSY